MLHRLPIVFLFLPSLALAVEVYRCTDPEGRISFSQTQCHPQAHMQLQDVRPIETIKAQAPNPDDLRYLEASRQRSARERQAQDRYRARAIKGSAKQDATAKDSGKAPAKAKTKKLKRPKSGRKIRLKIPKPQQFKLYGSRQGFSG